MTSEVKDPTVGTEFKRLKAAKVAVGNILREYELLAGKRKIPLLKSLIRDVREIYDSSKAAAEQEGQPKPGPSTPPEEVPVPPEITDELENLLPLREDELMESEEMLPSEQAMRNDVILTEVFRRLYPRDLKNMRLVNRQWRELCTSELYRRDACQINLYYNCDGGTYRVGSSYSGYTLENLSDALLCWKKFPSSDFKLCFTLKEIEKSAPELCDFFATHGEKVRTLRFAFVSSATALGTLLSYTPNLERLEFDFLGVHYSPQEQEFFQMFPLPTSPVPKDRVMLYKLKFLKVDATCLKHSDECQERMKFNQKVFHALLLAAPNLLSIDNMFHKFIRTACKVNKYEAIKGIEFAPSGLNAKLYKNFAFRNPKLLEMTVLTTKIFSFVESYASAAKTLNRILASSQDSLTKLSIQPLGFLGNVRFPQLKNLEYLALNRNEYIEDHFFGIEEHVPNQRFFAKRAQFTQFIFPKLKTVRFGTKMTGKVILMYLPWENPDSDLLETLPSVQSVEVANKLDVFGLRLISAKFPNVTRMKLERTQYSGRIDCHAIWEFLPEHLEHLEITEDALNSVDYDRHNRRIPFDSIFTGIPEKLCETLRQRPNPLDENSPVVRKKSSICDLRNLKTLRFVFANGTLYKDFPWFSQVTGRYAFQLMPQLKVTIAYDKYHPGAAQLAKGLEPIFPYVSFEHQKLTPSVGTLGYTAGFM